MEQRYMLDAVPTMITEQPHLWATFTIILLAIYFYATEKFSLTMTSILVIISFLLLFHFMPLSNKQGKIIFNANSFLDGFSNPALIAVLSLLVLGQAVVRTGVLTPIANFIIRFSKISPFLSILLTLIFVGAISAFVNNTPTVVIFIPILLAVASNLDLSASKVMIPLSYASILGGTTVLIGSSTNLLVSAATEQAGLEPLGFFDFAIPGLVIAGVGLIYIAFILPKLLQDRAPLTDELTGSGRQFVAQLEIARDSEAIGKSIKDKSLFGTEEDITIKMLQRREHAYLTPFSDEIEIQAGDIIIVAATREIIKKLLAEDTAMFRTKSTLPTEGDGEGKETIPADSSITELLVTPASKLIGQSIEQIGFHHNYHCIVLGMQRKSRAITSRMTKIRLEAGDVLLVMGPREDMRKLRDSKDMVVMEWSTEELPSKHFSRLITVIFGGVITLAATDMLPIHIGAFCGAGLVILSKCLNMRQAMRALDAQIVFLIAAGLAMSTALQVTGGATLIAQQLITNTHGLDPVWVMSALFVVMAILTNVLSNNASALLFTPIAISTALELQVPPEMFIYAVIFASNCCSLASPIGYQTNLLVMGPGHYKFSDYMRAGIPLVFLVWITYTAYAYIVWGS